MTEPMKNELKENKSLYERLGGIYGIAAVDNLVDRLNVNATANANPAVEEFHRQQGQQVGAGDRRPEDLSGS